MSASYEMAVVQLCEEPLVEICPSHPLHHSNLFVDSTLNIKEILNILPEFPILHVSQHSFHLLQKSLGFTKEYPRVLVGDNPIGKWRARQSSSNISGFVSLSSPSSLRWLGTDRNPRRSSCCRFPFCRPRRLPESSTSHRRVAYETKIPGVSPTNLRDGKHIWRNQTW